MTNFCLLEPNHCSESSLTGFYKCYLLLLHWQQEKVTSKESWCRPTRVCLVIARWQVSVLEEFSNWPAPMENLRNQNRKPHKEFFLFVQGFLIFALHCEACSHPCPITEVNPGAMCIVSPKGPERARQGGVGSAGQCPIPRQGGHGGECLGAHPLCNSSEREKRAE